MSRAVKRAAHRGERIHGKTAERFRLCGVQVPQYPRARLRDGRQALPSAGRGDVMSDVVMVYGREDIERAEQLAEMFDDFGFSVSCDVSDEALARCGAGIVVWTDTAGASPTIAEAVARVIASGKGVVLNFASVAAPAGAAVAYDLSAWGGDPEDPALDAMFFALDRKVVVARAARPVLQQLEEQAEAKAAAMTIKAPVVLPRGAPTPRVRTMAASLAVIGVVLAGALALGGAPEAPAPVTVVSLPTAPDAAPRMRLADASARQASYDLTAPPVEDATVGRRGFEPPSAASLRRAERTPSPSRSWERVAPRSAPHAPASFETGAPTTAPLPIAAERGVAKPSAKPDGHA